LAQSRAASGVRSHRAARDTRRPIGGAYATVHSTAEPQCDLGQPADTYPLTELLIAIPRARTAFTDVDPLQAEEGQRVDGRHCRGCRIQTGGEGVARIQRRNRVDSAEQGVEVDDPNGVTAVSVTVSAPPSTPGIAV
jgi:hypothetical protein